MMTSTLRYCVTLPTQAFIDLSQIRHSWLVNTVLYSSAEDWDAAESQSRIDFIRQSRMRLTQLELLLERGAYMFSPEEILDYFGLYPCNTQQGQRMREQVQLRCKPNAKLIRLVHICRKQSRICAGRLDRLEQEPEDTLLLARFQKSCRGLLDTLDELPRGPQLP